MEVDFKKMSHGNFDRYTFDIPHEAMARIDLHVDVVLELIKLNKSEKAHEVAAAVSILTGLIEEGRYVER